MGTVQQVINGLLLGGVLALVALGFSLVWGILNVINIAHGAFVMIGAFVTYWLFDLFGLDPFLSIPLSMLTLFVLGYALQAGVINWVVRAPPLITLLLTFGLDLLLTNLALLWWSADVRSVNPSYVGSRLEVGSLVVPYVQLAALALALVITGLLSLFLARTRLGQAILATAYDHVGARVVGISIPRIYAITFAISAALAGAAGTLIATIRPITPTMGADYTVLAFAIVVLGGLGSALGALIGGLVFGLVEVFATVWLGAGYSEAVVFAIILLVLLLRPQGILGREYSAGVQE